jgi:hypothetical protein
MACFTTADGKKHEVARDNVACSIRIMNDTMYVTRATITKSYTFNNVQDALKAAQLLKPVTVDIEMDSDLNLNSAEAKTIFNSTAKHNNITTTSGGNNVCSFVFR